MYEKIPAELKQLRQWVCWQAVDDEARPGKIKKIPIDARTGSCAQSNNPQTWCDFETALRASSAYTGVGFMFDSGYFGVDIDGVEDEIEAYRNGGNTNIVAEFIHTLGSYAEYSQSGRGIHIICRGSLPPTGRRRRNVEMYQDGRFFIMTGNAAASYAEIADCTEAIKPLHEKYISCGSEPVIRKRQELSAALSLTQEEILAAAMRSRQGAHFQALWEGRWEDTYLSQSEADMAFCSMLAFWCARDEAKMDAVFRASGLMRDKWDRRQNGTTYGAITLARAVQSCTQVYEPKPQQTDVVSNGAGAPDGERDAAPAASCRHKWYSFDDTGNAQRFCDAYADRVRYSFIARKWMYYDGRRWCVDLTGTVRRMADDVVNEMEDDLARYVAWAQQDESAGAAGAAGAPGAPGSDPEAIEKAFRKHLKASRSSNAKTAMLKEAQHRVPITPQELDTQRHLLNTPGGVINLRTGELGAHDAALYLSHITYAEYTDKSDCPVWESFLDTIFAGDGDLIRFVQKAVGYSLSGSTQEQCMFFCYGSGRNGKSTFLEVVGEALGDYAMNIQPETLMLRSQASGGPTGDIARLKGARFVTSPEPNEGVRLNEGLLKQLTGGDKITASKKYEDEFEFVPEFKIWMATNHKPVIHGTDTGIWRRIHLIPFTVCIPEEKVDRRLAHKLKKELPAILRWAVDGCLLWQREGLAPPAAVRRATDEYRTEMDVIAAFLEACAEAIDGAEESAATLYKAYVQWAEENGEYKMKNTKFGLELSKRFDKIKRRNGAFYIGLRLCAHARPYEIAFGKQSAV